MKAHNLDTMLDNRLEEFKEIISRSVCVNCIHRDDCMYIAKAAAPIHTCEMYDYGYEPKTNLVLVPPSQSVTEPDPATIPQTGLCINCENRESCKYEKPAGGVWHCEEYL